jgi:hypothetical protein
LTDMNRLRYDILAWKRFSRGVDIRSNSYR